MFKTMALGEFVKAQETHPVVGSKQRWSSLQAPDSQLHACSERELAS